MFREDPIVKWGRPYLVKEWDENMLAIDTGDWILRASDYQMRAAG